MLSINNIEVVYDNVILVLKGVSLEVKPGAITTLLGANGAGKTTTLKAISGVLRTERGDVTKGTITFDGKRIDGMRAFDVTKLGISQVFEGRRVFEHLTCRGEPDRRRAHCSAQARKVSERHRARLCLLSRSSRTGAHQLVGLSLGRRAADAGDRPRADVEPKVVLLDEPSLGLAPMLVEEIFGIVRRLVQQEKLSVLLVEQNAVMALEVADHGYVMENGRIVLEGNVAGAARQLRHPRVLSRPQRGRLAQVLPRREALQAPQALAVLSGDAPRIAAIVLAAGRSTRMGATNKLLADIGGKPMVRRVVEAALASKARAGSGGDRPHGRRGRCGARRARCDVRGQSGLRDRACQLAQGRHPGAAASSATAR